MGPEFFQTQMGQRFYNSTLPRIADALEIIADCMVKAEARIQKVEDASKTRPEPTKASGPGRTIP